MADVSIEEASTEPEREPSPERVPAKKRGRPPGAKNKPRADVAPVAPVVSPPPQPDKVKPKRKKKVIEVESSSSSSESEQEIVVKRKRTSRPRHTKDASPTPPSPRHATLDDVRQSLHNAQDNLCTTPICKELLHNK